MSSTDFPVIGRHSGEWVFSDMPREESKNNNSVLWNAMIHPLISMTIKGAIWYQGKTARPRLAFPRPHVSPFCWACLTFR